jgi:S-(hydroxymethyl)glutathione dehydrogenase/alcohol dehydrogenase
MKAAVLRDFSATWHIEDVDIADPIGDEVLVEVRASGLCHSDLLTATVDRGLALPILCGHEVAGVVTAIGPDVRSVKIGEHVTTCVAGSCEVCALCRSGRPWLCAARSETDGILNREGGEPPRLQLGGDAVTAVAAIGGFAEQALVPERALVAIDRAIPLDVAAILGCAVVTGIGAATNSARIRTGDSVAVIGCGGVGLNVIQGAHLAGAGRIIGVDLSARRLVRASHFGATDLVDASTDSPVEQVLDLVRGGVDHVFEAVGAAVTMSQAIAMLGPGGTAYAIGAAPAPVPLSSVTTQELLAGGKSIVGVYAGSTNFKRDIPRYADMYRRGRIELDALISNRISIADISETFRSHETGEGARAVIVF